MGLKNWMKEFKDFALKGNVLDMAVGVIIGGAFSKIVSSLVNDIIMPLFIFMCGAAIPYALSRRLKNGQGEFWRHVMARVVMLWVMGGCVQGNWLSFNLHSFSPFANTLQAIAIGYLASLIDDFW